MSGGYVKYNGTYSPLMHKAPGSGGVEIAFTPFVWVFVSDEVDYKWYEWKSKKSDQWSAKRRLSENEEMSSMQYRSDHQPVTDSNDPSHAEIAEKKRLEDELHAAKAKLDEYLKSKMLAKKKGGGK